VDLLITYTQHSELQVIIALSLISTIHTSPAQPFPNLLFFSSRSLAMVSNNGYSSASVLTSLLYGEYPATRLLSIVKSTIVPSLPRLPCRARHSCQPQTICYSATNYFTSLHQAEAYCRQPAGTLKPGIGPRWDPWPYICSMSRPLFCFSFR
jgi:hypothetical protein